MAEDLIIWTMQLAASREKLEAAIREGNVEGMIKTIKNTISGILTQTGNQVEGEIRAAIDIMAKYPGTTLPDAIMMVNGGGARQTIN